MAAISLIILGIYFLIGFFFALWFVNKGAQKIDGDAASANWKLKLLWLPGSMALWPVLLRVCLK